MSTQDEQAELRDERERRTIEAMTMIAPTPELLRQVLSLQDVTADEPAVVDAVPDPEPATADR